MVYDLAGHGFLAQLAVPGMGFILWSQAVGSWLIPQHLCYYYASGTYIVSLVTMVIPSWVKL